MLRDYEILYIVRPELDEEQLTEAVRSVDTLIANLGGETRKTDVWGRRRLAYEVKHLREGQYVLTDFQIEPARVPEMEATLKISESVFRHLIVRKPEPAAGEAAPEEGDAEVGEEAQEAAAGAAPEASVEAGEEAEVETGAGASAEEDEG